MKPSYNPCVLHVLTVVLPCVYQSRSTAVCGCICLALALLSSLSVDRCLVQSIVLIIPCLLISITYHYLVDNHYHLGTVCFVLGTI